ncbi:hypothetical protein TWF506_009190 [Arthrobotrys conoides]|uniref:F-box domain-containing protein n=1 Tax=Arthrobotrys conoides TaxID=74498 RepID=A0AAN8RR56_9PEZI
MPNLSTIPIELRIQILSELDNLGDLKAAIESCQQMHVMQECPANWEYIFTKVVQNDWEASSIDVDLERQLISLYKWQVRDGIFTGRHAKTLPALEGKEFIGPIGRARLLRLHRVIRWHSRLFLEYHLAARKEAGGPSQTELARLDSAFCILWIWIEALYPTDLAIDQVLFIGISSYALEGQMTIPVSGLARHLGDKGLNINLSIILSAYVFLRSRLGYITKEFAGKGNCRQLWEPDTCASRAIYSLFISDEVYVAFNSCQLRCPEFDDDTSWTRRPNRLSSMFTSQQAHADSTLFHILRRTITETAQARP